MSPPNITKLQKTKENENCPIYNFFFFKCPIRLGDNSRIFFRKTKKYPLNIRLLYQFLISSSKYVSLLLHYYKKLKSVKNSKIQISLIGSNQWNIMITAFDVESCPLNFQPTLELIH